MPTPTCCICQSATLINRQNLHTLAALAGTLDVLLRQYSAQQREQPPDRTPWMHLGDLLGALKDPRALQLEGLAQGVTLAANVERNWLGEFESLCLSCGFMLMEDDTPR
ncbi:hypothetical protein SAMN05216198_3894 [Halopseudomonas litoralis]|uniref:Uncharacterized protein n=1 Tax=Halopseudomonas litoralis TaxID=797277 RepID=A0A1H1Y853_9GAMM|nr:hypothetical protein [Halopseudomonas litoralis]SDT17708.1 hypothetical protein SAMN05216198_3894 [Halopseudomonas litoralis]